MTTSPRQDQSAFALRTLGGVSLRGDHSAARFKLRKKDLALLIYLCIEGGGPRSRVFLSSLLWGDRPQPRARHSLTQAVGRLRSVIGNDALIPRSEQIHWRGSLSCDAFALERAYAGDDRAVVENMYAGDFLADFEIGSGAEEFDVWAEQRRARYRTMALHVVEGLGAQAEAAGRWPEALELGRRAVEIEALYEAGHRRIMRALTALGERGLALSHYGELALWLQQRVQLQPDPATTQLATELRSGVNPQVPQVALEGVSNGNRNKALHPDDPGAGRNVFTRMVRAFGNRTSAWRDRARP